MKKFILLFFLSFSLCISAQESSDLAVNTRVKKSTHKRSAKKESTFNVGEWLKFRMHYGALNASYATLHVKSDNIDGVPVYHVVGKGKTTGWASIFLK